MRHMPRATRCSRQSHSSNSGPFSAFTGGSERHCGHWRQRVKYWMPSRTRRSPICTASRGCGSRANARQTYHTFVLASGGRWREALALLGATPETLLDHLGDAQANRGPTNISTLCPPRPARRCAAGHRGALRVCTRRVRMISPCSRRTSASEQSSCFPFSSMTGRRGNGMMRT